MVVIAGLGLVYRLERDYSCSKSLIISIALLDIGVPGPNIAATPAL